ncbi:hypothetical protein VCHA49P379_70088 [Vibrio chagasii]|nr:hypothetical protein VCHA49P379_70088 [Vibrio chagasii]
MVIFIRSTYSLKSHTLKVTVQHFFLIRTNEQFADGPLLGELIKDVDSL